MFLDVNVRMEESEAFLSMKGILDISTTEIFNGYTKKLNDVKKVNIDFSKVEFIDSTGVGSLVQVIKSLRGKFVEIKVTNVSSDVFEVLDILGVTEIFSGVFEQKQDI